MNWTVINENEEIFSCENEEAALKMANFIIDEAATHGWPAGMGKIKILRDDTITHRSIKTNIESFPDGDTWDVCCDYRMMKIHRVHRVAREIALQKQMDGLKSLGFV